MGEPTNPHELKVWDFLNEHGWTTYRNGNPDIFAERDNELIAIEVKGSPEEGLSKDQEAMFALLGRHNIKCYRWSPDINLKNLVHPLKIFHRAKYPNTNLEAKIKFETMTEVKRNRRVLELRSKGLTMPEIAAMLGLTKQRIFAILKRAASRGTDY